MAGAEKYVQQSLRFVELKKMLEKIANVHRGINKHEIVNMDGYGR
jgi:hypothetical protein